MKPNFAIIATGGKQSLVHLDGVVKVEKLEGKEGDSIKFDSVLAVGEGEDVLLGKPQIEGATVLGTITKQGRAKKVVGVKFKPKKRVKTGFGHRQLFTEVKIAEIKLA